MPGNEITIKSTLTECLEYMRDLWRMSSKNYDSLIPMPGMEEKWEEYRTKCRILEDLIHANDSEPVRRAISDWQQIIMEEDQSGQPHSMQL